MGRLLRGKGKDSTWCQAGNTGKVKTAVKNKTVDLKETDKTKKKNLRNKCSFKGINVENEGFNNCDINKEIEQVVIENRSSELSGVDSGTPVTADAVNCCTTTGATNIRKVKADITHIEEADKVNGIKLAKNNKTDIKNYPVSKGCNGETSTRPVLFDKTNSVIKISTLDGSNKKNKVHFSSTNSVRRITQRRISDFFHNREQHHKIKEFPELASQHTTDVNVNESLDNLDKTVNQKILERNTLNRTDLSKTVIQDHVPVYKQPVVNGRKSFRLTPPQVKNKETLYEFEVDENEEPRVNKKKRRPVKTYKKRKRLCVNNILTVKEFDNIPQRTMTLRTDHPVSVDNRVEVEPGIKIDTADVIVEKSKNQLSKNKGNVLFHETVALNQNIEQRKDSSTINRKCGPNTSVCGLSVKPLVLSELSAGVNGRNERKNKQNNDVSHNKNKENCSCGVLSNNNSGLSVHCSSSHLKINGNVSNGDVLQERRNQNNKNPVNHSTVGNPSEDISSSTLGLHSPLPEYSRLDEGIQVGPVYESSSINCSESEFANNFMRGVTASTPFRQLNSPIVSHNYQVRLSGGEALNTYHPRILVESDSESEEEFFGFRVNENHDDSISNVKLSKTTNKQTKPKENEPVQKVSIKEVITILKKDVVKDKKQDKKKGSPLKLFNHSLSSPSFNNSHRVCHLNDSHDSSQQEICQYMTNDQEMQKNKVQFEEPSDSFSKPPRRSYINTPRKRNVVNFEESEHSEDEVEVQKKPQKKAYKPTKKEEKEMDKFAAKMNSQFQEVEKFKLLVE